MNSEPASTLEARGPTWRAPRISALMSTYESETASNLATSLASIEAQSVLPDQLVLVIDGPVGADQEDVIAAFIAGGTIPTTLVRFAAQSRSGRSPEFWAYPVSR